MTTPNPLFSDRLVDFLLDEVHDASELLQLPAFSVHSQETLRLFAASVRRLAREQLFPAYRAMDAAPPAFREGRVLVHPAMRALYPAMVELGLVNATRPVDVGGQSVPLTHFAAASAYLMAANLSAYGFIGLTSGAAHLVEAFGSDDVKRRFLDPLHDGRWTGTMALTEPQAGSSLADVKTKAIPLDSGTYAIRGSKVFISGGDQDFAGNVVHLTLARIEGAPDGTRGLSLFAVPRLRPEGDALVDNDVQVAGLVHKLGWRGIPSVLLELGAQDGCRGWLVGEPHRGIAHMFQMMNEARLMIGLNGVATASVAYQEALAYARTRPQGRAVTNRDATSPQVPIIEHADVRRMLLRQKAIVEGGLSLLLATSRYADLAEHAETQEIRLESKLLLDLLTPVAKSFPAEAGFEANTLALQVHGGYGYSTEYPVEAWWRDQKLNSLHEGTTGIQALDLLGRKVVAGQGAALQLFAREVTTTIEHARTAGVEAAWCEALATSLTALQELTAELAGRGLDGDVDGMLLHARDFLELVSVIAIGWQWVAIVRAARREDSNGHLRDPAFVDGLVAAAEYWVATELSRAPGLAALCRRADVGYGRIAPDAF